MVITNRFMEDCGIFGTGSNKGSRKRIGEDVDIITGAVREYLPDFPEPEIYDADEHEREEPFTGTGAFHYKGDIYLKHKDSDSVLVRDEFPQHIDSIHEMGHVVGEYLKQSLMPSYSDIFTVLNSEELEEFNNLPDEEENILEEYGEIRNQLSSGHFAAGFEHALRNDLGLTTDSIEEEKRYADAEDGCVNSERDYFWNEQDESSIQRFLHNAAQEVEDKRKEFFKVLPEERMEEIEYKHAEEILAE